MQAKIFTQDLLKWEDFEEEKKAAVDPEGIPSPPSPPPASYLLSQCILQLRSHECVTDISLYFCSGALDSKSRFSSKHKETRYQLANTTRAMERFAGGTLDSDDDDEEAEEETGLY